MLDAQILDVAGNEFVALAPPRAMVGVAAFATTAAPLNTALGVTLPTTPRAVTAAGVTYLWSGPGSWLALSDDPALESRLRAAAGTNAAITDQSDGRVILTVSGPHARKILAKVVPIDLHESAFPPDATALTLADSIGVQIWREAQKFHLACFRSFAESLGHALVQAASEFV